MDTIEYPLSDVTQDHTNRLTAFAEAALPTARATFRVLVFQNEHDPSEEHVALVLGEVAGKADVLARVHSECLTGEVLGSLRCDCRDQLDFALDRIAEEGAGVLVYLRQEGRGIGLGNKIRAYALQDAGQDTVEANLALGFEADHRSYEVAADILRYLEVASVRLLTNNPDKIAGLTAAGIAVSRQESHWVSRSPHSEDYLAVKRAKLGHIDDEAPKS